MNCQDDHPHLFSIFLMLKFSRWLEHTKLQNDDSLPLWFWCSYVHNLALHEMEMRYHGEFISKVFCIVDAFYEMIRPQKANCC
jgi:hypothetical protein